MSTNTNSTTFTFNPTNTSRVLKSRVTTTEEIYENGKLVNKITTVEEEWEDVKPVPVTTPYRPDPTPWWGPVYATDVNALGSTVEEGMTIGYTGNGKATGPHIHLDKDGIHFEPQSTDVEEQVQRVLKRVDAWKNRPKSD